MRERDLLQHIYEHNTRLPGGVTIPPGDDMGAVRIGQEQVLVTVDQAIDGVHFRLADTPLELIGRKAMTRNLSDVAAMAALPVAAVAAAALPRSFTQPQADALFDAMRRTAEHYDCPLIGGDVSIHDGPLTLTVTVLASPAGVKPVLRSGAKVGDLIAVTGRLGKAWSRQSGGGAHLTFEPRIAVARRLATLPGLSLHSMIDISDGLSGDLAHICQQSGVGAEIRLIDIPLREGATPADALTDGEDYELLFTFAPTQLPAEIDGVPLTVLGHIIEGSGIVLVDEHQRRAMLSEAGWEHRT